jgi:hypothetical protein
MTLCKEIARRYKEQRHMKRVDKVGKQFRRLGMTNYHQDDSDSLADGYRIIPLFSLRSSLHNMVGKEFVI